MLEVLRELVPHKAVPNRLSTPKRDGGKMSWKGGIWAEIISMLRRSGPARVARKVDGSMRRRTLVMVYSTAVFMWSPWPWNLLLVGLCFCWAGTTSRGDGRASIDIYPRNPPR